MRATVSTEPEISLLLWLPLWKMMRKHSAIFRTVENCNTSEWLDFNHCGNNDTMAWFSLKPFMSHTSYVRGFSTHLFKLSCFCMGLFSCIKLKYKSIGVIPSIILQINTNLPRLVSGSCKLSDWNLTLLISKECMLYSVSLESTFWNA